jgi:hypothetical protein
MISTHSFLWSVGKSFPLHENIGAGLLTVPAYLQRPMLMTEQTPELRIRFTKRTDGAVVHVVGLLDRERVGGAPPLSAAEFNAQIAQFVANDGLDAPRAFTEIELAAVRQRIETLHRQWAVVSPGSSFELTFDRGNRRVVNTW